MTRAKIRMSENSVTKGQEKIIEGLKPILPIFIDTNIIFMPIIKMQPIRVDSPDRRSKCIVMT